MPRLCARFFATREPKIALSAGELTIVLKARTERLAPTNLGEPPGTVSHTVVYLDGSGRAQAIAHEYLRPDGSIGASGQRDPKWLRFQGTVWKLERAPSEPDYG